MRSACDIVTLSEVSEAVRRTFPIMCNIGGRHVRSCEVCCRVVKAEIVRIARQKERSDSTLAYRGIDNDLEMVAWNLCLAFFFVEVA